MTMEEADLYYEIFEEQVDPHFESLREYLSEDIFNVKFSFNLILLPTEPQLPVLRTYPPFHSSVITPTNQLLHHHDDVMSFLRNNLPSSFSEDMLNRLTPKIIFYAKEMVEDVSDDVPGNKFGPRLLSFAVHIRLEVRYDESAPWVSLQEEDEVCSICQENFDEVEVVSALLCGHVFHDECIDPWLNSNQSCPLCRFQIPLK